MDRVKIATKIPPTPGYWLPHPNDVCIERYPENYLRERVEFSLQNLGAETLDLVQLHTWSRAWNSEPVALKFLQKMKEEGKIQAIGISTPEHDQNSLIDLMKNDWLDTVQVIYNIFEQEPEAEFLSVAQKKQVGVIVRVVFDEGALTGKFTEDTTFPAKDFRRRYFKGDRLKETVKRVEALKKALQQFADDECNNLPSVAIRFALHHNAVSTVIPGIRNVRQAEMNCRVSDQPKLSAKLYSELKKFNWYRAFWYGG